MRKSTSRGRYRRSIAVGVAATVVVAVSPALATSQASNAAAPSSSAASAPSSASASASDDEWAAFKERLREAATTYAAKKPVGLNPATSLVPPGEPRDYQGWAQQSARLATQRESRSERAGAAEQAKAPLSVEESEPADGRGQNDSPADADALDGFGTGSGQNPAARLTGTQSPEVVADDAIKEIAPNTEDDGTPETARDTGIPATNQGIKTTGFRGDGSGDLPEVDDDLYKLTLEPGDRVTARMAPTSGNLQPLMLLVDENLNPVADTFLEPELAIQLNASVPKAGTYYLLATGFVTLADGPTTGDYDLSIAVGEDDRDVWAFDLEAGDVLGATVDQGGYVSVTGPDGAEQHRSSFDASGFYPIASPLPGAGGNPNVDYVAAKDGRYFVEFGGGRGAYQGGVEVYRYGGEGKATQTVFLDTDGARVNTRIWGGGNGVVTLSPLSSFMSKWGLAEDQEDELVKAIKANLKENLEADLRDAGLSDSVALEVVSSNDGVDLTGRPNVSRIILGGTIEESGIPTVGIAESIDPGNFDREDTALVLLDVLSEPASADEAPASLNTYLKPESDKVRFIAQGVGNVTTHEAGHMLGNFHTENTSEVANLMDAGGNFAPFFGVGPDNVGGTADDDDVDFEIDIYDLFEGSFGFEDTRARSIWALSR